MALSWNDVNAGIRDAEATIRMFRNRIESMASLVSGNLRSGDVGSYTLRKLKRELKKYNMHTGEWKD